MKNIALVIVLSVLVGVAYFYEEIYKTEQAELKLDKNFQKTSLFKSQALNFTALKTKNYHLVKRDQWVVQTVNYPADEKLITELRKIFSGIKIKGLVKDSSTAHLFKNGGIPFSIVVGENEYKYLLGEVSIATGRFYIKQIDEKEDKIYVCEDDSYLNIAYKNEIDLLTKKYLRFKALLQGQKDLLIDRALFKLLNVKKLNTLIIDNKRNRRFQIDLEKNTTEPLILKGLKYKNFNQYLSSVFNSAIIKAVVVEKQKVLSNLASEIIFYHDSKKSIAKLYKGLNEKYGYYVKFDAIDYVFEVDEKAAEIFFLNVQDLWSKKLLPNMKLTEKDSFKFSLSHDDEKYFDFEVNDLNRFKIVSKSDRVISFDQNLMNMIFNLVFNLVDFKEAKYVDSFTQVGAEGKTVYIKLFDKKLGIELNKDEIIVWDVKNKIKHHYQFSTDTIGVLSWEDIFTLSSK